MSKKLLMSKKLSKIPQLQIEEFNHQEQLLWQLLQEREEFIGELKDEIARLKGEKARPKIKPSRLEPSNRSSEDEVEDKDGNTENQEKKKRAGSAKRHKTKELEIHETILIKPNQTPPPNSEFKGYQDYTVQELMIKVHNVRYRMIVVENPNRGNFERKIRPKAERTRAFWFNG